MRYTNEELEILIQLYERIGTFSGVAKYLKEQSGISISDTTIKKKIQEKFEFEGRHFGEWLDQNKKTGPKYTNDELNYWEELYEMIGSFLGVSKHIESQFGIKIHDTTIKRGLERKFKCERRDFEEWVLEYDRSKDRSGFKEYYAEKDILFWIELYEEIGSYKGVVKYLKKEFGDSPIDATIKRKIRDYFKIIGKNFKKWEEKYSKFSLGLTQGYSREEVERWEKLYERIGSFQGVSDYIKEIEGKAPADITIKRRLKNKFKKENRNFESWIKKYEDWHFKLYTDKDVKYWIDLYQRIGSFYGVETFLRDSYGFAPDNYTIYTRIKQKFEAKNRNFQKWSSIYGQQFLEEVCRAFFERIFSCSFSKSSPGWLINPLTNRRLHLDGFNEEYRIAFEYNGPQHYIFTRPYHKTIEDLLYQEKRDEIKAGLCRENKILLIIVPYTIRIKNMQEYIMEQYEKLTGKKLPSISKLDYRDFFYNDNLDRFL